MKNIEYYYLVTNKKRQGVIYNEGIAVLSAISKKHGANVNLQLLDYEDVHNGLQINSNADYHGVGFSSLQLELSKQVVKLITQNKKKGELILGGIHATLQRESLIDLPGVDAVVSGEGENFIEWLLEDDSRKLKDCFLPNVWLKDNELKPLNSVVVPDLNELPFPDRTIFDREMISQYPEFIFSRGCPFSCAYCANEFLNLNFGHKVRKKSPEYSIEEILGVVRDFEITTNTSFTFHDDIFINDKKWLMKFADLYIKNTRRPFRCNTTASMLNEEKAEILKEMNCQELWIGIEVGNEKFRREILGKKVSNEQIKSAFATAKKFGINTVAFILLGVSGERRKHVWDTMKLCRKVQPNHLSISLFVPLPGTSLYEMEKANNNLKDIDEEFGDLGVVQSGVRRKAISDKEYSYYEQLLQYYTQRKTLVFFLVQIWKLPILSFIRPVVKRMFTTFRNRLLLEERTESAKRNQ